MAGFRYEALDVAGRHRSGVLETDSPRQARAVLRKQGLWPIQVDALASQPAPDPAARFLRRLWVPAQLPAAHLALLMRQFATLLAAKLTLEQTLDALVEQAETQPIREILAGVRGEVLAGQSLARAMAPFPRAFPEMYRTLVEAGERSGKLPEVMGRLADYVEQRQVLHDRIVLASIYPAIVTVVAFAVIIALLSYVVPQIVGVFQNANQALPWLTQALIATSSFVRAAGWYLLAGGLAAIAASRLAMRQPGVSFRVDEVLLRLPVLGPLVRALNAARLASTLSILLGGGVPVLGALQRAAGSIGNLPMRRAVQQVERMLTEGASLSRAISATGMFPPIFVHLVASGEASGELGIALERASENQAREVERRVALLISLLEPLLILAMGAMVLLIVLAILMPIVELNQLIR